MLYDFFDRTVKLRLSDNTVIKTGSKIRQQSEVAALRFIAQLGLPTPRVLEVFDGDIFEFEQQSNIRMNYIEGQTLESVWPTMSTQEKRDICLQLRQMLDKMREAEWPATTIGSCDGGPVRDGRLYSVKSGGPFTNQEDLNNFILDIWEQTPQPMRDALIEHQRSTNYRIVFAHGDLHQNNILVKDGKITGLIDWEQAGWYPEYWDYVKFCTTSATHKDWLDYTKDVFSQTYEQELLFTLALSRFQKG